ncbi:anhydro-N-acetylmuramic acid kinase [Acidithiobacillus sp. HP-6]|nr:anhydro-N-acetylmuramic acid kinase [Acidithiobacillus sp. HP-6]MBE7569921.1 anhydro-N-acetylmuramic acid kinase [Acidithiobacillus sp. HP-2]
MRGLGLMSGTSADGVDAAVLDFDVAPAQGYAGLISQPFAAPLRKMVLAANGLLSVEQMAVLDRQLGACYAEVAQTAISKLGPVDFIALHGQTIRHQPRAVPGFTLQIGSAADVAIATGLTVVHDFRRADVAAGGEGAPLVPPFHQRLFQAQQPRLVLNLGGMANLTWIPGGDDSRALQAFDTGPGNVLIDAAVRILSGGEACCDLDGKLAAAGKVQALPLAQWLKHPYFRQSPPKSTGRESFDDRLVHQWWNDWKYSGADFVATLTALTAITVADALRKWTPDAKELLVFGGGAENPTLMRELQSALPELQVHHGAEQSGIPSQALEALAFAWLGEQCLRGKALAYGQVTGVREAVVLGNILPGRNWAELLSRLAHA